MGTGLDVGVGLFCPVGQRIYCLRSRDPSGVGSTRLGPGLSYPHDRSTGPSVSSETGSERSGDKRVLGESWVLKVGLG